MKAYTHRGTIYLIVPRFALGGRDPAWGIPPGVYGCGYPQGWQVMGFREKSGREGYASWIYPTREQAQAHRRRYLAWLRRPRKRRKKKCP